MSIDDRRAVAKRTSDVDLNGSILRPGQQFELTSNEPAIERRLIAVRTASR